MRDDQVIIALICGDRHWNDSRAIDKELKKYPNLKLVIEGGADGADKLGRYAAERKGIQACTFHANWVYYGKPAGPIRNGNQIRFIKPDIVLAFHSRITHSKGTKNMIDIAKKAKIQVRLIV
jgi:SLOG family YspA-like protein